MQCVIKPLRVWGVSSTHGYLRGVNSQLLLAILGENLNVELQKFCKIKYAQVSTAS